MTNDEREALIALGWTPPKVVDPDWVEAERIRKYGPNDETAAILAGIKRGRALATAEAKPGVVWVKYDGSGECPVDSKTFVMVLYGGGSPIIRIADGPAWEFVSHYAVITLPAEDK